MRVVQTMTPMSPLPAEPRILVIAMRRLGDVLLTTPLVRSLRLGFAGARVDMLVFRGTEGILAGNPDIDAVTAVPADATARDTRALVGSLWRRYDLAISTQTGDRPTFLAYAAGRRLLRIRITRTRRLLGVAPMSLPIAP